MKFEYLARKPEDLPRMWEQTFFPAWKFHPLFPGVGHAGLQWGRGGSVEEACCSPENLWQHLDMYLVVTTLERGASGIEWAETGWC